MSGLLGASGFSFSLDFDLSNTPSLAASFFCLFCSEAVSGRTKGCFFLGSEDANLGTSLRDGVGGGLAWRGI